MITKTITVSADNSEDIAYIRLILKRTDDTNVDAANAQM